MQTRRATAIASLLVSAACAPGKPQSYAGFVDGPIAAVAAQVAGRVDSIAVREGDRVRKGDVLAQLDARERQASVVEAESNVAVAREALTEAEANLSATLPTARGASADIVKAQATLLDARQQFDRTARLVHAGSLPQADLDSAQARLDEARASLDGMMASKAATQGRIGATGAAVANARASIESSAAALAVARVQLDEAQILSPFDALIVERNLEPGEWAAPGTPVVTVQELSQPWVRLDVPETELGLLRIGQPAEVKVVALGDRALRGHVIEVGAEADFAVNRDVKRGRPDVRTFRVRVAIEEAADQLRPGMTAEVRPLRGSPVASNAQAPR